MVNTKRVLWQFKNFFKDDGPNKDVFFLRAIYDFARKAGKGLLGSKKEIEDNFAFFQAWIIRRQ